MCILYCVVPSRSTTPVPGPRTFCSGLIWPIPVRSQIRPNARCLGLEILRGICQPVVCGAYPQGSKVSMPCLLRLMIRADFTLLSPLLADCRSGPAQRTLSLSLSLFRTISLSLAALALPTFAVMLNNKRIIKICAKPSFTLLRVTDDRSLDGSPIFSIFFSVFSSKMSLSL